MTFFARFSPVRVQARKVWALSLPYFQSDEKWRARGLLAGIVALNLGTVYLLVLLNDWNRTFYDALQNKDQPVFWAELVRFCWIAASFIAVAVYKFYFTQLLEMRWRRWMTAHYMRRWLDRGAFYQLELARFARTEVETSDNPDQRIQEDVNQFTSLTLSLSMGVFNAVVTLLSFVGILWALSGSFSFEWAGSSYRIPGFMVWMALLYCAAGSLVTHWIGRRLTPLNFQQQRLEADFRHHMVRVREYSEAIALDRGAPVERAQLDARFGAVLANYLALLRTQKNLLWFTNGFAQVATVFPLVIAAPRFFAGAIQLGELMQVASAFGRVQDSLSWLVDNYDRVAAWSATTSRLTRFEDSLTQIENRLPDLHASPAQGESIELTQIELLAPTADASPRALLYAPGLSLHPGDLVRLSGPSGCGKSTLFRALAGLWPWAKGQLALPAGFAQRSMFIPQRPYLSQGKLRDALAYPEPSSRYTDTDLQQALRDALLPDLATALDEEAAWNLRLSGGEQQRLAIARVLLKKPRWVFADEATSALDLDAEKIIQNRLLSLVASQNGAIVSIAHGADTEGAFNLRWQVQAGAGGSVLVSQPSP
ncbi:MAG: Inner rane transporter ATP-binding protein YddA [Pseudomonadota bacterium]|jgi:putative ATP-binding cassette transporter